MLVHLNMIKYLSKFLNK